MREGDDEQVLSADVAGVGEAPYVLWYRIPARFEVDDVAATHAFLVSVVNQAMAVGRDVEIDGPVSRGLLENLDEYQRAWATWLPRRFRRVEIRGASEVDDTAPTFDRGQVVPFSGGLDSAYTATTLAADRRLGALVSIEGLAFPLAEKAKWAKVLASTRACAASLGVPAVAAVTNWMEASSRLPGFLGYMQPALAVPLLLATAFDGVALPSGFAYDRLVLPLETNPLTDRLLGRPGFPVRQHGAWASRLDKVRTVARWPEGLARLRPCERMTPDATPCLECRKCVPTALLFAAAGLDVPPTLGGRVPPLAVIENVRLSEYSISAFVDAIEAARARGMTDAWIEVAQRRVDVYAGLPRAVGEARELRRRLRYLLGGRSRSRFVAMLRRVTRAFRGRTGPDDLEPLPRWPYMLAREGTGRPLDEPAFATTARGRKMYVDADDWRGTALIEHGGNLGAKTRRVWETLLASDRWTHVVDVGANYGEMLLDVDLPPGARVIALEPNPHVRRHLERSLREADLPVEIVAKAASDHEGRIRMSIDRSWSGTSGVVASPKSTTRHRMEEVEVETTTLRSLLDDGTPDAGKRVLCKLDVEGHELAILRGLGGAAPSYGAFVALVEICDFSDRELAAALGAFEIQLFDEAAGTLVPLDDASPQGVRATLDRPSIHRHDAVFRARRAPS